jgi:hypothetical protein
VDELHDEAIDEVSLDRILRDLIGRFLLIRNDQIVPA